MENKIGIIGVGMVGGAHKRYYDEIGFAAYCFDPAKGFNDPSFPNNAEVILICVPTPYDKKKGGFDLSFVREALKIVHPGKIAVIKSTVLPGSTEKLQNEFPKIKILFSPEFLTEATAYADVRQPVRQIVGYTEKSKEYAQAVLDILPKAGFSRIVMAKEAELVKYFGNSFYALKVAYANQMYDLCQKAGIDYDSIKECVKPEPMVGSSHLEIFHKGKRGYGGKCLPKDVRSVIQFGDSLGVDMKLLRTAEEINFELNGGVKE